MADAARVSSTTPIVEDVPTTEIRESPFNPRKTFKNMEELAEDVGRRGVLQPILARPIKPEKGGVRLEVVFGARRFRAAKLAGLESVPVMVRELGDEEALEIMIIENAKRDDVHPLEEAQGFHDLHHKCGVGVERIAERTGRSVSNVYDLLRLMNLTKEAQKLFIEDRFTYSHAVILSRLKPEDQERALEPEALAVFEHERPDLFDPRDERDERPFKARSVRELQAWVDRRIKFDATAPDVPQLFPETAQTVVAAMEDAEKIVPITFEYQVHPDARDGSRVLTSRSWKRADGLEKSKTCEHAVTGVIVIGPGRGEAFKVCTDKKKCAVHWAEEQREAKKRAAGAGDTSAKDRYAEQRRKQEEENAKREAARARWQKALPAIAEAVNARVKAMPAKATGLLADIVAGEVADRHHKVPSLPRGKSAEDLVRHLASCVINAEAGGYFGHERFPKAAKAFGIDVAKILDAAAPLEPKPKAPAGAVAGECRVCHCTEDNACEGGCSWEDETQTLCSECVGMDDAAPEKPKKKPAAKKPTKKKPAKAKRRG